MSHAPSPARRPIGCRSRRRFLLAAGAALTLALPAGAQAATGTTGLVPPLAAIRVGLYRRDERGEAALSWQPVADALQRLLGGRPVRLEWLDDEDLEAAMADNRLDFVVSSPPQFVRLRRYQQVRALATARIRVGGWSLDQVGGVIFARAEARHLNGLQDVRQHRVLAVTPYAFGGFLLAEDAFREAGVDLYDPVQTRLDFSGYPPERVVQGVLSNAADVGIVRTGVLEDMIASGALRADQIKVLNARPTHTYPQRLSTELGPCWAWSALPSTDPVLVGQVTRALLRMAPDDAELRDSRYAGFSPPASYANVDALLRRLHAAPAPGLKSAASELWERYQQPVSMILATAGLISLGLSTLLWRSNRRLRELSRLYLDARAALQTTAAAFDSQVGLLVTDSNQRILRVNAALTQILGYAEAELKGQRTDLLRSPEVSEKAVRDAWTTLLDTGNWRGELLCRHASGRDVPCLVTISIVRGEAAGMEGFVGSFVDISQQRRDQAAIEQLAFFDVLTGLPNRRRFLERLHSELEVARASGRHGALLFIDLDHFKTLNDAHGHALGDELLKRIAQRLAAAAGPHGLVARLGGDEFVVMLGRLPARREDACQQATEMAERARAAILQPYRLPLYGAAGRDSTLTHRCTASIGVALFGHENLEAHEVMKHADIAMYLAKQAGRNTIGHFDPQAQARLHDRAMLAAELADALVGGQLQLHFQVQVDGDAQPQAAECLLRWEHPSRGALPPAAFIAVAEETGAIVAIGDWVIREALATLAKWQAHPSLAGLNLCVNVSPRQFTEPDFVSKLQEALAETRVPPARLTLELTESIVLARLDSVEANLRTLRDMGVLLALDDFGTGYSSMTYLQRLPLHQVKIDSSFIVGLPDSPNAATIVRTIVALGRSLGLAVVAEGVETTEQRSTLVAMGCDLLQGFEVGAPQTLSTFEQAMTARAGA